MVQVQLPVQVRAQVHEQVQELAQVRVKVQPGNTKWGSTVDLLFDWFGISCMTTDNLCFYLQNKPVKQEVKGTVILPPLVFPGTGTSTGTSRGTSTGASFTLKRL
jgi:hypothetical protein